MMEVGLELVARFIAEREPAISEMERIGKAIRDVFKEAQPDQNFEVHRGGIRNPNAPRSSVEQVMEFEVYRVVESPASNN